MNRIIIPKAKTNFSSVLFYLREYLFPSGCGGCGRALLCPEDAFYGLCETCRTFIADAFNEKERCAICGKVLISEKNICFPCKEKGCADGGVYNEYIEKAFAIFPYTGVFRSLLKSYKFERSLGAGNFLARCLDAALSDFVRENGAGTALVPVPPRPGKIKKEGWDQIEYLAKLLEKEHRKNHKRGTVCSGQTDNSFPVRRCLRRLPSRSQKELNREERSGNLKGRVLCVKPPPKTAIIFDDVITTGATLNACASALIENGTEKVYALCLFYD